MEETTSWLKDARRLNRHVPCVHRALDHAEESRRLNLRALGTAHEDRGLRGSVDALQHSSVSMRTRSVPSMRRPASGSVSARTLSMRMTSA